MTQDRRGFLQRMAAFMAGSFAANEIVFKDEAEHTATITARLRIRDSQGETEVPLERRVPTDLQGFTELGISEEMVVKLAVATLVVRAQAHARSVYRRSFDLGASPGLPEEMAQRVFAEYKPEDRGVFAPPTLHMTRFPNFTAEQVDLLKKAGVRFLHD